MRRAALVVVRDPHGVFVGRTVGDAVPLARRIAIGRRPDCDVVVDHHMVPPLAAYVERTGDQWWVGSLATETMIDTGVWVNGRRIRQRQPLLEYDLVEYGGAALSFEIVEAAPLWRVSRFLDTEIVLIGAPDASTPGRRRAFRRRADRVEQLFVVTRVAENGALDEERHASSSGNAVLPRFLEEHVSSVLVHRVFADLAGPRLTALRAAGSGGAPGAELDPQLEAQLTSMIAAARDDAVMNRGPWFPRGALVVTWDGALRVLPFLDGPNAPTEDPHIALPDRDEVRYGTGHPPADAAVLASIVRALFADAWRAEALLREELATLDDDGIAWLLG